MTNDPDKVWPGGIVHYVMDTSLGKFLIQLFPAQYMLAIVVRTKVVLSLSNITNYGPVSIEYYTLAKLVPANHMLHY